MDGSGELSEFEFFHVVDQLGLTLSERQRETIMAIYDSDHSGAIQFEEFLEFTEEVPELYSNYFE